MLGSWEDRLSAASTSNSSSSRRLASGSGGSSGSSGGGGGSKVSQGSLEIEISHEGGFVLDIVPDELKDMMRTKNFVGKLTVQQPDAPYLEFLGYIREPEPFDLWPGVLTLSDPNDDSLGPTYGIRIVQCYKNCAAADAANEEADGEEYSNCAGDDIVSMTERRRLAARVDGAWQLRNATHAEVSLVAPSADGWRRYMNVTVDEPVVATDKSVARRRVADIDGGRRQLTGDSGEDDSGDCYAKPQFVPFWIATACLDLANEPSCATFQISAILSSAERIFTVKGSFVGGDLKPLWFLPGGLADIVIIEANEVTPLEATMELDLTPGQTRELTFNLNSRILLNIFDFELALDCRIYGVVPLSRGGPRPTLCSTGTRSPNDLLHTLCHSRALSFAVSRVVIPKQCLPSRPRCHRTSWTFCLSR